MITQSHNQLLTNSCFVTQSESFVAVILKKLHIEK